MKEIAGLMCPGVDSSYGKELGDRRDRKSFPGKVHGEAQERQGFYREPNALLFVWLPSPLLASERARRIGASPEGTKGFSKVAMSFPEMT